ncbi:hypothetical protein FA95DRAFT_1585268 [Auriscalpium vulgare]|uniref:Uncharacterized protein n=1 Tax=Auriscalpium vulgare TaxID=40419 RepID=A0ACB8R6J7_9AGAM|nr:hypothetical protein FA95DRAFT_1585268 [Auriscalpium vulgare]
MLLRTVVCQLARHPELLDAISLQQVLDFISFAAAIKSDICFVQPTPTSRDDPPPAFLSPGICSFLADSTAIPYELIDDIWALFRDVVWAHGEPSEQAASVRRAFDEHGLHRGITLLSFYPPHRHCINPLCSGREPVLGKQQARQVVAFTLDDGARPAWAINLYCSHCQTTYHHNYSVRQHERTYYPGIPDFLQVGEHQFIAAALASAWTDLMVVSWVSATNCARSYEMSLSQKSTHVEGWQFGFSLTTEQVWDAFILLALLRDHERRSQLLHVPHSGEQRDRFVTAMQRRNELIVFAGQPELRHYCDRCMRIYEDPDTSVPMRKCQPIVVDGITLGHPCCGVFGCKVPLANNRHRFCPVHTPLHYVCAVNGCDSPVVPGSKTCSDRQTDLPTARTDAPCPSKSATGNVKRKAQFGRRRTHNEQIIVRPCGVVVARATFYGAEAVSNVLLFVERVFEIAGALKPDEMFYDTACAALREIIFNQLLWWRDVGLPVDVFHHKTKHTIRDLLCQLHCNPANFPELLTPDGKWYFNSSAAEQTNAWLGGYQAICREMLTTKYNFFLDEMIMRRNVTVVERLRKQGHNPMYSS